MYEEYWQAWGDLTAADGDFAVETIEVRGNPCRVYSKAPNSLRDLWLSSQIHGNNDYLVYGEERLSYAATHQRVANLCHWLSEQGVSPGDRVAIAMRNYPEWMQAYWAVVSMGATVVGMNAWWTEPEMSYALDDSKPAALIVDQERLDRLEDSYRATLPIILVRAEADGTAPWEQAVAGAHPLPAVEIDADSDACIFYTSGTTGRPKGAQLTHRGCVSNVWSLLFSASLARLLGERSGQIPVDFVPPPAAALVTTPLFHVTANNCVAQGTTMGGGKLVHMYKWDAGEALKLIERESITSMSGVPVMARELIAHPDFSTTDTSSLATLGGGGAQLQPDLVGKIDTQVATARPNTGYGMTETCGVITSISGDFFVDKPDSCGPALPVFESRIVNDAGEEVETGELQVRGAHVIRGYLNREEATRETIQEGWLRTGDVAKRDADGFLYIVDRLKDMVLRGGENIYCAEVESALFEHPEVSECSVFGVPDDRLGEEVGVAIYTQGAVSADELREHCAARLASFKIPRYIWIVDTALPRNASGKFLKRELRDTLALADAQ